MKQRGMLLRVHVGSLQYVRSRSRQYFHCQMKTFRVIEARSSAGPPYTLPISCRMSAYVSIRQHTSSYVSICQHLSAYVSIRLHTVHSPQLLTCASSQMIMTANIFIFHISVAYPRSRYSAGVVTGALTRVLCLAPMRRDEAVGLLLSQPSSHSSPHKTRHRRKNKSISGKAALSLL